MSSPKHEDSKQDAKQPVPVRQDADGEMDDPIAPSRLKPEGVSSKRDGGEAKDQPAQPERKRKRIDDGKRSARMFGNILGTLRKFQDDEGKTKKSEAVRF